MNKKDFNAEIALLIALAEGGTLSPAVQGAYLKSSEFKEAAELIESLRSEFKKFILTQTQHAPPRAMICVYLSVLGEMAALIGERKGLSTLTKVFDQGFEIGEAKRKQLETQQQETET